MFVRLLASAGIAFALMVAPVPSASAVINDGAVFNNPTGSGAAQRAVLDTFSDGINGAPAGSTIRLVTWRIEDPKIIQDLTDAFDRGVHVQMVVNNRPDNQFGELRNKLGNDRDADSFLYICSNGCRTRANAALHSKFFTFDSTGGSSHVVMVSSSNLTRPHATEGWNDVYTIVGRSATYDAYNEIFLEMKADQGFADPYRVFSDLAPAGIPFRAYFFPRQGSTKATDTIYTELGRVRCSGATGGTGNNGNTIVRVMMFHWADSRGVYLARRLKTYDDNGCDVRVIYGAPSGDVVRILNQPTRNGGVKVYDSRFDQDNDGVADKYVHMKALMISGNVVGDSSSTLVYTGSQNWTNGGLRQSDEVVERVIDDGAHAQYAAHFDFVRQTKTRPVSAAGVQLQLQQMPEFSEELPEPN